MAGEVVLQLRNDRDSARAELECEAGRGEELLGIPGDRSCRPTAALYELDHAEPDARPQLDQAPAQRDLYVEVGRKHLGAVAHVGSPTGRATIVDPAQADVDQPAGCHAQYQTASFPVGVPHPVTTDRTDL